MIPFQRRRLLALLAVLLAVVTLTAAGDPLAEQQWHVRAVGAADAWETGRGEGAVVAVVDTGVDVSHPDLAGRSVPGIDLVDEGTPPDDPNGHGTLVAGIVAAAADNGHGGAGIAPLARVMPVRVLDEEGNGSGRTVAAGIRWATANGADVINLSLADADPPRAAEQPRPALITPEIETAIEEAHRSGVLVVAAAGNDARASTPYRGDTPVLVVGALDHDDRVWHSSNADERTLFAPGTGIVSTYLEHGYARADGTSFATPVVAGGAAILAGQGLSSDEIALRLLAGAVPVDRGVGRVDLAAALSARIAGEGAGAVRAPAQGFVDAPSAPPEAAGAEPPAGEPGADAEEQPGPAGHTSTTEAVIDRHPVLTDGAGSSTHPEDYGSTQRLLLSVGVPALGDGLPEHLPLLAVGLLAANVLALAAYGLWARAMTHAGGVARGGRSCPPALVAPAQVGNGGGPERPRHSS